jgi:hypothetical protein
MLNNGSFVPRNFDIYVKGLSDFLSDIEIYQLVFY